MSAKLNRIGEIYETKRGEKIKIIKYNNSYDCDILFLDYSWIEKNISFKSIKKGSIKSPFTPSVYNVGYLGEDFYKYKNVKSLPQYVTWRNMLKRCYCEKHLKVCESYKKTTVCEEWHNFSNFYKWYNLNYYKIKGEKMCLDKDILNKNANQYSPENCVFAPDKINLIFEKMKRDKTKNRSDLPLGVQWIKADNIYGASCRVGDNQSVWLGRSHSIEECFNRYKQCKEKHIKKVADYYKDKIPNKLYQAMYDYEVEITD